MIAVFGQRCCCSFVNTYSTYQGNRRAPPRQLHSLWSAFERAVSNVRLDLTMLGLVFLGKTGVVLVHIARRIEVVQKIALLVTH